MAWGGSAFDWLNGLSVIGDSLVTAFGTVIAAVLAVLSGVWTYILSQRREGREAELKSAKRVDDLVTALHAEIIAGRDTALLQTDAAEAYYAETNEIPFGPADDTDFVFASIKNDITILDIEVIHEVVEYYRLAAQSNLYTRDLKDPLFLRQTPAEKKKYMRNLIDILNEQERAAVAAYGVLEDYGRKRGLPLTQKRIAAEQRRSARRHDGAYRSDHLEPPEAASPQI